MRRLTRGTIREARNILTLTRARAAGGGSAAIPQPTAQNQIIISNATPAWALLAAPTVQYQVPVAGADPYTPAWAALTVEAISDLAYAAPALTLSTANAEGAADTIIRSDATILVFDATVPNTIQPDDAAVAGTATVAARRDHEHAIVCAAPASPSVNLSTSAEGTGTSFARADHTHQLAQSIVPTWTNLHTFSQGTPANQHAVSYRLVLLENDGSANLQIISEHDALDVSALVLSRAPAAGNNEHWVVAHREDNGFSIGYHSSTGTFSTSAVTEHLTISSIGYLGMRVADDTALAAQFRDVGGTEYWRVISTDAQPVMVFNEYGADIDYRFEASGEANALFVRGSDGNVGCKTSAPAADWHVVGGAVANKHYSMYRTQVLEDGNAVLQLISADSSTWMCHVIMTGAPTTGDNEHWIVSHLGPDANNRFSIGYLSSSATDFSNWGDVDEYLTISTAGVVSVSEGIALKGAAATLTIEDTTDALAWRFRAASFRLTIDPISGATRSVVIHNSGAGGVRLGLGCVPNSALEIDLATENLEIVDAGSAGATEQDWVEVEIGGVTGYIRIYAAK